MPQLNPTNIGKQIVLSSDAASVRTVLELGTANSPSFSGLSFSGTDTPGLQLKSLTSAQIADLATASALPNGSILLDATNNKVDVRINGVTESLISTRGGQTINGALGATSINTNAITSSSTANVGHRLTVYEGMEVWNSRFNYQMMRIEQGILYVNNSIFSGGAGTFTGNVTTGSQCTFGTSTGRGYYNTSFGLVIPSNLVIGASSNVDAGAAAYDASISRAGPGLWQFGTTGPNAAGSVNFTNATASGQIATGLIIGTSNTGFACHASLGVQVASSQRFGITSGTNPQVTPDVQFTRNATGPAWVSRADGGFQSRNLANGADAPISGSNLTASGTVTSLEQIITNGANSTRVARATGATGRIQIYRPNDPATVSVEFGGGNDEIRIRNGSGTLSHTGSLFQIGSASSMQLSAVSGTLTLGSNLATAQTITGANTVFGGTIIHVPPASVTLATNGQFSIEMTSNTAGNLVYRGSDGVTRRAALTFV